MFKEERVLSVFFEKAQLTDSWPTIDGQPLKRVQRDSVKGFRGKARMKREKNKFGVLLLGKKGKGFKNTPTTEEPLIGVS